MEYGHTLRNVYIMFRILTSAQASKHIININTGSSGSRTSVKRFAAAVCRRNAFDRSRREIIIQKAEAFFFTDEKIQTI